jgi:hypothetical protein
VLKDLNFSIVPIIMENIIEPDDTFDFSKLSLANPSGIQGGAYFTKIEYIDKPLYIQTCKSVTRQGFVKTGKKYYCDLMFDKNSETLINWFENLENKCQKLIYEKRDKWFQNSLEENDIETAFNSIIRVYKSGKYYLVRTNIKNTRNDEPSVKIYNENEVALTIKDVTNETNIISILEIQGIKFTSRSFQIDIELKQVMVLDNEPIFNNCLIKKNKPSSSLLANDSLIIDNLGNDESNIVENIENIENNSTNILNDIIETKLEPIEEIISSSQLDILEPLDVINQLDKRNDNISLELEFEDLNPDIQEDNDDNENLREVNIDVNLENLESLKLKKPNQVYFELYKQARNKAKIAKKNAILAYLEVKNIKKTYMLENLNDNSDSDFDAEIDEVSESELEGL